MDLSSLSLVFYAKGRAVFRPTFAPIVEARRRYIGMPEPLLDLGDIGIVRQSIGSCRCAERVHAQPDDFGTNARFSAVFAHYVAVHRAGIERPVETAGAVVFDRPEQSAFEIAAMSGQRDHECAAMRVAPAVRRLRSDDTSTKFPFCGARRGGRFPDRYPSDADRRVPKPAAHAGMP